MKDAGFGDDSNRDLLLSMLFLSIVMAISNFIGTLLTKTLGRREMVLLVSIPMGICLIVLDGAMILNVLAPGGKCKIFNTFHHTLVGGWLCLISLTFFLIFFCIGFATQPWTISAEVFPNHLRGLGNSFSTTANWFFNFLTSAIFL